MQHSEVKKFNPPKLLLADLLFFVALGCILYKDFFIMQLGVHFEIIGIILIIFLAVFSNQESKQTIFNKKIILIITFFIVFSWIGSSIVILTLNTSSYYAAFAISIVILRMRPKYLIETLTVLVTINTLFQILESLTGEFIFVYVDDDFSYDEKMLSTSDGGLRTKGLYGSPLNGIGVAMSLCFLAPKSKYSWFLLCASSLLGQGRLGLGIGIVGLLVNLFRSHTGLKAHAIKTLLSLSVFLLLIASWMALFATEDSVTRMLEAGSADNSQNISRFEFWLSSINQLINYDLISLIFGKFGYIKAFQGGTESDWLRMWLDNGFIFFLTVLSLIIYRLYVAARKKDWLNFYASSACIFVMAVYPHAQSFPNGLLTWLFLLSKFDINSIKKITYSEKKIIPSLNRNI
ncbi:MAG: hypothetical protein Q7R66_06740 [Undibacterium sp.]|uniref:hypothetical protein n=1 Tax=Undibacterium sp. TaxID=1914977 RepID=UPI0027157597|nr:hypothetical protein [Undibacterium sp.]MDO8651866.1 hypothetical protein [Undibacterium sp.]